MKRSKVIWFAVSCAAFTNLASQSLIVEQASANTFPLIAGKQITKLVVDPHDHLLVTKAAVMFQQDIDSVSGNKPALLHAIETAPQLVIIGSLDRSKFIKELVEEEKLVADSITNKWEAYTIQVVERPYSNVEKALVIAGSDRRGTAYALFELSRQMGVSPWYYWADVPVKKKTSIYYQGRSFSDAPAVKYRGIFINDEAPALSGWSKEMFGGFNHLFYEKVFELILRLKGNYLWPAMWGSAFYDDDSLNAVVADQFGIVMGTTHHEPLGRAHDEWRRYGIGKWNYDSNEVPLKRFWRTGVERMKNFENIVSVGMRGDGDEPMTKGTAIALLERIVADQRKIIEEVTSRPAAETLQLWALYKEVQDYYDQGMRVPDDVTLLLCDDNWGNIRKLPKLSDPPRKGGYGIYYHFDYVGGPRNYKWINTVQVERTWEQMHLAYRYGVDKIWIVNVGDIKPMEFPISFFLDYAWKPESITADNLPAYYEKWAGEQFGKTVAKSIADVMMLSTKYISRKKPELLSSETFSIINYNEAARVNADYGKLLQKAKQIELQLATAYKDAYYQLVRHPIEAMKNLQQLYTAVAWNHHYAERNDSRANAFADKAKQLFEKDAAITNYYNDTLADGKWHHMMDQTHIGYTYWQQPPVNKMPGVKYITAKDTSDRINDIDEIQINQKIPLAVRQVSEENIFYESDGYVSIEACHFTKAIGDELINWQVIPNLGRTGSGITTFPVTTTPHKPGGSSPHLQYQVYFSDTGNVKLQAWFSPTLPFHDHGLQYAISVNEQEPMLMNLHEGDMNRQWNKWVSDNMIVKTSEHHIATPGFHTVKYWLVDPAVVFQKLLIDTGGLKPSYLGPPETLAR